MPTYDFECRDCAYYAEIKQGINDPSTLTCPHCEKSTLVKVFINAPAMFVRGEPTTIGHQADRNTQKMGKYELQEKSTKTEHWATRLWATICLKNTEYPLRLNGVLAEHQKRNV